MSVLLPDEMVRKILEFVPDNQLWLAANVCRQWYHVAVERRRDRKWKTSKIAVTNTLSRLQWALRCGLERTDALFDMAHVYMNAEVLDFLQPASPQRPDAILYAAMGGHDDFCLRKTRHLNKDLLRVAIYYGRSKLLTLYRSQAPFMDRVDVFTAVGSAGRLDYLQYLMSQEDDSVNIAYFLNAALVAAIRQGHLSFVQYVMDIYPESYHENLITTASRANKWDIVEMFVQRGHEAPAEILIHAVTAGHLPMVKLVANPSNHRMHDAMVEAGLYGHLHILRYLLTLSAPGPDLIPIIIRHACDPRAIILLLREMGATWTCPQTITDFDFLQWLHKNHFAIPNQIYYKALRDNRTAIVQYMETHNLDDPAEATAFALEDGKWFLVVHCYRRSRNFNKIKAAVGNRDKARKNLRILRWLRFVL